MFACTTAARNSWKSITPQGKLPLYCTCRVLEGAVGYLENGIQTPVAQGRSTHFARFLPPAHTWGGIDPTSFHNPPYPKLLRCDAR